MSKDNELRELDKDLNKILADYRNNLATSGRGVAGVIARKDFKTLIKQHTDREVEPYRELIMAVESNFEGETRHQTALRYIREAERCNDGQDTFDQLRGVSDE